MGVLEDMFETVSPYTVGATGTITQVQFDSLVTLALLEYNRTKPSGLPSSWDNNCLALIIASMVEKSQDNAALTAEKIGDYSYTKKSSVTESVYIRRLNDIYCNYASAPSLLHKRDDSTLADQFKLDQESVETFDFDTSNVVES